MTGILHVAIMAMLTATSDSSSDAIGRHFRTAGVDGTFLLYDLQTGRSTGYRPDRWDSAYIPASTFKIFSSLVALESGAIRDTHTVLQWDSVPRPMPGWNQDMAIGTAFRVSAVWFYQELARRIGQETMQAYLDTVGYGNRTMGGPIDSFWLDGGLRISPRQQVELLVRLYRNALPFSSGTMASVREIMVMEKTQTYVLRAKTGLSGGPDRGVGWYVGYVVRAEGTYFFATEIQIRRPEDSRMRVELTKTILRGLKILA